LARIASHSLSFSLLTFFLYFLGILVFIAINTVVFDIKGIIIKIVTTQPLTAAPNYDPEKVIEDRASASYIAEYSAPKITLVDTKQFKLDKDNNLNNKIKARLGDLQREYKDLEDLYNFNLLVDEYQHSFIPVAGHVYYLYNHDGHKFLSLIEPDSFLLCKDSFVLSTRYNGQGFFEREGGGTNNERSESGAAQS
jgi:hypothetical protein